MSEPSSPAAVVDSETNIKELVEAILVAFILAFMFRTFIVEAFVIPTGSMAPTLLGAHMHFHCDDCGYQWDVNYPSEPDSDEVMIPTRTNQLPDGRVVAKKILPAWCPNCGYPVAESAADT